MRKPENIQLVDYLLNLPDDKMVAYGVMLITAFFLVGGMYIYTKAYRKRGLISDKIFFALLLNTFLGLLGDTARFFLPFASRNNDEGLQHTLNILVYFFDIFHDMFDILLVFYVCCFLTKNRDRYIKLIRSVLQPAVVVICLQDLVYLIVFVVLNVDVRIIPDWLFEANMFLARFYHVASIITVFLFSKRLVVYYVLAILTSYIMEQFSGWGQTSSMMNAQILILFHIFMMNLSFYKDELGKEGKLIEEK